MFVTAQQLEQQMPDATRLLSDEPEMETSLHYMQLLLLVTCLEWLWRDSPDGDSSASRNDFFIGANLTIYFSRQQLRNRDFRGPDFFLVKDTEKYPRSSWVVWEEDGRYPDLIIELLSESTADVDRNLKKSLYENRFHTPEYFWFSPENLEFVGFELVGNKYQEIVPDGRGWRWSEVLGLYLGVENNKLRYFTPDGKLVPTPEEAAIEAQKVAIEAQKVAIEAQKQASQTESRLEEEQQRSQRLAEHLRSLGVDPDSLLN
ncbi:Uma2 family endonuclease [Halotia wernerae UHCC 0503]|nr:Uma2 family endonuclease [Halotia wernerae UHCC 0503]